MVTHNSKIELPLVNSKKVFLISFFFFWPDNFKIKRGKKTEATISFFNESFFPKKKVTSHSVSCQVVDICEMNVVFK